MAEKEKVIRKFRVKYNFMGAEVYICLCGNVPELGSWNPFDGVIGVKRTNTNDFTATIKIERGTALEFKWVTLDINKRPLRWEAFENKRIVVNEPEDVVVYDVQWDVIPKIAERKPKPASPMYAYTASLVEPTAVADQCLHISSTVKSPDKKHVVFDDVAIPTQPSTPPKRQIPVETPRTLPNIIDSTCTRAPPLCEEKPAKKFPKYLKWAVAIGAAGVAAGVVYYVGKRMLA
ncbi:uncharacterized protein LOC128223622 [Mya arenaria]|uniref:uncharacterized protein LOC128223622 n=1 Tax=Mya arenaria TaxID=6604 RepID=UPI0022E2FAC0|nr:uncharacterized protein LOC128223622 [Mya arenaria]